MPQTRQPSTTTLALACESPSRLLLEGPAPSPGEPARSRSSPPGCSDERGLGAVLSDVARVLFEERPPEPDPPRPDLPHPGRPRLIERRCPYCHDGLGNEAQVLCAGCVTPHHAACFGEHGGCSLLGCDAKRSLDLEGPTSRILCATCSELTPSNAPFCAKCGGRHGPGTWSASRRASRKRLQEILGAAAVLLFASFAIGASVGSFRSKARLVQLDAALEGQRLRREVALKDHLRAIQRAQVVFAGYDLDADGEANYAVSVAELKVVLNAAEALAAPDSLEGELERAHLDVLRADYWSGELEIVLTKDREGRQLALGRWLDARDSARWACDLQGRIEPAGPDLDRDGGHQ